MDSALREAALRETIDALKSTAIALHALAAVHHQLVDSDDATRAEIRSLADKVDDLIQETGKLATAIETRTEVETSADERTDSIRKAEIKERRETRELIGKVLTSRTAVGIATAIVVILLQLFGQQAVADRLGGWFLTEPGLPAPVVPAPEPAPVAP